MIIFSAQFNDSILTDTEIYYEIEVNTNDTFTGTVMWDTGQTSITPITNGTKSSNIDYDGNPMTKGVTYYWSIRFWDNKGLVSPWSSGTYLLPFLQ